MSNITKIAPYAYLAKRNSIGTIFDLYLLVPVDSIKIVNLDNVQPVKGLGNRVFVSYASNSPSVTEPIPLYKFKHWEIDSEGTYVDIHIQGDGSGDLTTIMVFAEADTEPATSTTDQHTFAPYLFVGTEMEDEHLYFRPSSIVLFEGSAGAMGEGLTFSGGTSSHTLIPGDGKSAVSNPENFAVNQDVRHEIPGTVYTFDGTVDETSALAKPIRKVKTRKMWATFAVSNTLNSEELAGANTNI